MCIYIFIHITYIIYTLLTYIHILYIQYICMYCIYIIYTVHMYVLYIYIHIESLPRITNPPPKKKLLKARVRLQFFKILAWPIGFLIDLHWKTIET